MRGRARDTVARPRRIPLVGARRQWSGATNSAREGAACCGSLPDPLNVPISTIDPRSFLARSVIKGRNQLKVSAAGVRRCANHTRLA